MRFLRHIPVLLGIYIVCLGVILPHLLSGRPVSPEIWIFASAQETGNGFHLIPLLNGTLLNGINPVVVNAISFLAKDCSILFRLIPALIALIFAAAVYGFVSSIKGVKTGFLAAILTVTSFGFFSLFEHIDLGAIPATMAVCAYLLFSSAYLKNASSGKYIFSYILAGLALITGGLSYLVFFTLCAVSLVLLDLAPERFLKIKLGWFLMISIILIVAFSVTYRIAGGSGYVSGVLFSGQREGFFCGLWDIIKFNLPWLPLLIPAWIKSDSPDAWESWRSMLPAKIVLAVTFLMLWLIKTDAPQFAFLTVPFACIITGVWVSGGIEKEKGSLASWPAILTGTVIIVSALIYFICGAIKDREISIPELLVLGVLVLNFLLIFFTLKRKGYSEAILLGIIAIVVFSFFATLHGGHRHTDAPAKFFASITKAVPLVVYEDDLITRGYLSHNGQKVVVVKKDFIPFGGEALLALKTGSIKKELKRLKKIADANLVSSCAEGGNYAIIALKPLQQ